ncbi:MAG: lipoate--protein ligase family protein [Candidatus Omnitrophica bacterium]|nr:lipoate--protein ligase family protein [Candidatus Omnitrophota bacterium]
MKFFDYSLPTPEENLACDEALLESCETGSEPAVLRFWEPDRYFVVLGYAGRISDDIRLDCCAQNNIPILRRLTGGGTVLQGPGCLNYSLILHADYSPALDTITGTNRFILGRIRSALTPLLGREVAIQGHTDLTLGDLKFAGNSQRRRRRSVLFHGSILRAMDLSMIEQVLTVPPKRPSYRGDRSHLNFLTNLNLPAREIKKAIRDVWRASGELRPALEAQIASLLRDRYSKTEWNCRF